MSDELNYRTTCQHPNRTDLKSGDGFRCDDCGEINKVVPIGSEAKPNTNVDKMSTSRYTALQASGKKAEWTVWDGVECKVVKVKGIELFRKANAVRIADEMNGITVNSIKLNGEEKGRAAKDKANKRKAELKQYESNAKRLVVELKTAKAIEGEIKTLRVKFIDTVRELLPLFENVCYGFNHLHDGETIDGFTSIKKWTPERVGVSYRHLSRVMNQLKNPTPTLVLTDGTKMIESTAESESTEKVIDVEPKATDVNPLPEIKEGEAEDLDEAPNPKDILAVTTPSFGISISPADVTANSVRDNARIIIGFAQSFRKFTSASEYQEMIRLVIQALQYELGEENVMQLGIVVPTTEGTVENIQ